MYPRMLAPPTGGQSLFLFGPRGTGKTTWLKQRFPEALYLDLLDHALYLDLLARPERLRELIPPRHDGWIVLDEVQRVPLVLNEVHRLIESDGRRFILTGSSARSLRRRGVNLLGGRARTLRMYPLTAAEAGSDFSLERALVRGQLPSVYRQPDPERYLASYVESYLRQEVIEEGRTRNLAAFSRFLESASFSQAAPLNVAEVAREVGVDRKTAAGYFDLLEDLLLATRVPVFARQAKHGMRSRPKFFLFDAGVYRTIRPRGPLDRPEEIDGAALETLVHQELRAHIAYRSLDLDLFTWRTASGAEVDLVAYGGGGLFAFEVKRSRRVRPADLRGLTQLKGDYPMARCVLLYGGDRREYRDGIEIVPVAEALADPGALLQAAAYGSPPLRT
ncbi:MAG: ATP-binding protein [Acidobacteria bacterium]|nr:ATP-binding protein [Acidobacteriota bacterium]